MATKSQDDGLAGYTPLIRLFCQQRKRNYSAVVLKQSAGQTFRGEKPSSISSFNKERITDVNMIQHTWFHSCVVSDHFYKLCSKAKHDTDVFLNVLIMSGETFMGFNCVWPHLISYTHQETLKVTKRLLLNIMTSQILTAVTQKGKHHTRVTQVDHVILPCAVSPILDTNDPPTQEPAYFSQR